MQRNELVKLEKYGVRTTPQLVVLVVDVSPSMEEKTYGGQIKIKALNEVMKDFIQRLKMSRKKDNFDIALVIFYESAEKVLDPIPVVELDSTPTVNCKGNLTSIASGLNLARKIVDDYLEKNKDTRFINPVVIVITDGEENINPNALKDEARRLQDSGVSLGIALLPHQDESISAQSKNLMRSLVSNENLFIDLSQESNYVDKLRSWLIKSVSI